MDLVDAVLSPFRRTPWHERVALADGRVVTLSAVTPAAKPLIARAIERVSPESSRRRFFTVRRRFSERELDEMTALDGWNRYAIGASARGADGPVGAAVARFARLPHDPTTAEMAMLVVDDFQGVGLGRMMLMRIVEAASERGVERFSALVLRDNAPMLALLRRHAPGLSIADAGEHVRVEMPLPPRPWWAAIAAA